MLQESRVYYNSVCSWKLGCCIDPNDAAWAPVYWHINIITKNVTNMHTQPYRHSVIITFAHYKSRSFDAPFSIYISAKITTVTDHDVALPHKEYSEEIYKDRDKSSQQRYYRSSMIKV